MHLPSLLLALAVSEAICSRTWSPGAAALLPHTNNEANMVKLAIERERGSERQRGSERDRDARTLRSPVEKTAKPTHAPTKHMPGHALRKVLHDGWTVLLVPWCGVVLGFGLACVPMMSVRDAVKTGHLGSMNVVPNAMLTLTSTAWLSYGFSRADPFVAGPNLVGCEPAALKGGRVPSG